MRDIGTKVDGSTTLSADDFNSIQSELRHMVESTGQTLDPAGGPDSLGLYMLAQGVADYANAGATYVDSGTANTHVLNLESDLRPPTKYTENFTAIFKINVTNTSATVTVDIHGMGVINIVKPGGVSLDIGDFIAGQYAIIVYNDSTSQFELVYTPSTSVLKGARNEGLVVKNNTSNPLYQVDITADYLTVYNVDGVSVVLDTISLTADIETTGANGRSATEGAEINAWYHIWVIFDGTTTASYLTQSSVEATVLTDLPSGYTYAKYVGAVYNDTTPDFVEFHQVGNYVNIARSAIVLNTSSTAWQPADCSAIVPTTATIIRAQNTSTTGVWNTAMWWSAESDGSGPTTGQIATGENSTTANYAYHIFEVSVTTPQMFYGKVVAGWGILYCVLGWHYNNIV